MNKQHYTLFEMIYIRPFPILDIYTDSATEGTFWKQKCRICITPIAYLLKHEWSWRANFRS